MSGITPSKVPLVGGRTYWEFNRNLGGTNARLPKRFLIEERVAVGASSSSAALVQPLPPRCKIIWSAFKNSTAPTVGGGGACGTARTYVLVQTAPTSLTSTGTAATNEIILQASTTLNANTATRGPTRVSAAASASAQLNLTTSNVTMNLVPYETITQTNYFMVVSSQATSGYYFSASANIDVLVYGEQLEDAPDT